MSLTRAFYHSTYPGTHTATGCKCSSSRPISLPCAREIDSNRGRTVDLTDLASTSIATSTVSIFPRSLPNHMRCDILNFELHHELPGRNRKISIAQISLHSGRSVWRLNRQLRSSRSSRITSANLVGCLMGIRRMGVVIYDEPMIRSRNSVL